MAKKLLALLLSGALAASPAAAGPTLSPTGAAPAVDVPVNPGAASSSLTLAPLVEPVLQGPETLGRLPLDALTSSLQPHLENLSPLLARAGTPELGLLAAQSLAGSLSSSLTPGTEGRPVAVTDAFLGGSLLSQALGRPELLDQLRERLRLEHRSDPRTEAVLGELDQWAKVLKDEKSRALLAASLNAVDQASRHVLAGTDHGALNRIFDGGSFSAAESVVAAETASAPAGSGLARPGGEVQPLSSGLDRLRAAGYAVVEAGAIFSRKTLATVALIGAAISPLPQTTLGSSRSLYVYGTGWIVPPDLHEEHANPIREDVEDLTRRLQEALPGERFHLASAEVRRVNANQVREDSVHVDGQYLTLTLALSEDPDQGTLIYPVDEAGAVSALKTPTGAAAFLSNDEREEATGGRIRGVVHQTAEGSGTRTLLLVRWTSGKLPDARTKAAVEARELLVRRHLRARGKAAPPLSAAGRRSAGAAPAGDGLSPRVRSALRASALGLTLGALAAFVFGSPAALAGILGYFLFWGLVFPPIEKGLPPAPPAPESVALPPAAPGDVLLLSPLYNEGTKGPGLSRIEETLRGIADQPRGDEYLDRVVFINDGSSDDSQAILERLRAELRERFGRDVLHFVSFPKGRNQHKEGAFKTTLQVLRARFGALPPVLGLMDSDSYLVSERPGEAVIDLLRTASSGLVQGGFDAVPVPIVGQLTPRSGLLEWVQAAEWANLRSIQWVLGQLSRVKPLRALGARSHTTGIAGLYDAKKLEEALEKHSGQNFKGGDYELDSILTRTGPPASGLASQTELMTTARDALKQGVRSWEGAIASVPLTFSVVLLLLTGLVGLTGVTLAAGLIPPAALLAAAALLAPGILYWALRGGSARISPLARAAFLPLNAAYLLGLNLATAYLAFFNALKGRIGR